jgi:hypothetical protein
VQELPLIDKTQLEEQVRELEAAIKDCIDTECRKCYNYKTCDDKTNYGCGIYKLKKILNNEET